MTDQKLPGGEMPRGKDLVCDTSFPAWIGLVSCLVFMGICLFVLFQPGDFFDGSIFGFVKVFCFAMLLLIVVFLFLGIRPLALGYDRVETDGRVIRCWRRRVVRAERSLRDLERVKRVGFEVHAAFTDGEVLRIPMRLSRTQELEHYLGYAAAQAAKSRGYDGEQPSSALVESQTAVSTPRGTEVVLPVDLVTFPDRCVRCGGPAETTRRLQGYYVMSLVRVEKAGHSVPLCLDCAAERRRVGRGCGILTTFGFIGTVALIILLAVLANSVRESAVQTTLYIAAAILAVALMFGWPVVEGWLPRYLDGRVLGVRLVRLRTMTGRLTLRFRDGALAKEVVRLVEAQQESVFRDSPTDQGRQPDHLL